MNVSVIIPVYNAEKFLPVCLESLAIQTLRDFEVIVVDDCSTDSSLAVAESFVERFDERLKIFTLPTNTGSGAVPRNVGFERACGDYVYFVDADDLLIDNALETFYDFAAKYRADVVFTGKFFTCDEKPVPDSLGEKIWLPASENDAPTLESDDISERVKLFVDRRMWWPPWTKFLRRQFLVDNDIKFLPLRICEDAVWTFKLLCLAKRWLTVPTSLYIHRANQNSLCKRTRSPREELELWSSPLTSAVEYLNDFMSRFEFFGRHPNYAVLVINILVNECFLRMSPALKELSWREAYEIFLRQFASAGPQPALTAWLIVMANIYRNELIK